MPLEAPKRCRACFAPLPPHSKTLALIALVLSLATWVRAQGNFEVQVYESETVPARAVMVELHSNYTVEGQRQTADGTFPTHHAWHETVEVTYGFNSWFEMAIYQFTSIQPQTGFEWVGTHLRPRVRAPEEWHLPVGLSLSTEIGYQRREFDTETWTWELRPIVDKKWGPFYAGVNLAFEKSLHGDASSDGFTFSPCAKVSFDVLKQVAVGLEYYSALGQVTGFEPRRDQEHILMPAIDWSPTPKWEINFGVGFGLTQGTDDLLIKLILGRQF